VVIVALSDEHTFSGFYLPEKRILALSQLQFLQIKEACEILQDIKGSKVTWEEYLKMVIQYYLTRDEKLEKLFEPYRRKKVTMRMTPEKYDEIKEFAKMYGYEISKFIQTLLEGYKNHLIATGQFNNIEGYIHE
jgi:hypothetical protein